MSNRPKSLPIRVLILLLAVILATGLVVFASDAGLILL